MLGPHPLAGVVPAHLRLVTERDVLDVEQHFVAALFVPDLSAGVARVLQDDPHGHLRPCAAAGLAVTASLASRRPFDEGIPEIVRLAGPTNTPVNSPAIKSHRDPAPRGRQRALPPSGARSTQAPPRRARGGLCNAPDARATRLVRPIAERCARWNDACTPRQTRRIVSRHANRAEASRLQLTGVARIRSLGWLGPRRRSGACFITMWYRGSGVMRRSTVEVFGELALRSRVLVVGRWFRRPGGLFGGDERAATEGPRSACRPTKPGGSALFGGWSWGGVEPTGGVPPHRKRCRAVHLSTGALSDPGVDPCSTILITSTECGRSSAEVGWSVATRSVTTSSPAGPER